MGEAPLDQEEALIARMLSGRPFTYGQLCADRRGRGDPYGDSDRLIDRTVQKLRRRGLIAFERIKGQGVVWTATQTQEATNEPG